MTNAGKWGLCFISIGCIFIMTSSVLIGLACIVPGIILAVRGRKDK